MAKPSKLERRITRLNKKIRKLGSDQQEKKDKLIQRRSTLQDRLGKQRLSDPNQVLKGRDAMYAAKALEKLISKPGIDAERQRIDALGKATERDTGKLGTMGDRLRGQMDQLASKSAEYGREAYGQSVTSGDTLQNRLRENSESSINRTNQLQSSVLGQQISSLQGANVNPSDSGSAQIMGQFAQANQQAAANNAQSFQDQGAAMAFAANASTQAGNTSAQNQLSNRASDIQRNITTRISDRMFQGSQDESEAQARLATLKSLRGAELVNQLMKLRGGERDFLQSRKANALEKLAITTQAQGDAADRAIDQYEAETKRMGLSSDGGGGGGGDKDDLKLDRGERKTFRAAAETVRQSYPGGKIGSWPAFFNDVAKQEGVNWSPVERRKFAKRYKRWYRKNKK